MKIPSPYFLRLGLCVTMAGLAMVPACSKKKEPAPEATTTAPATPVYKTLADAPEAERTAMDAFARKLEKDLKDGNSAAAKASFDLPGMMDSVLVGVNAKGSGIDQFRTGMNQGLRQSLDFVLKMWMDQDVTYKHLVVHEGKLKPRFRLSSDSTGIAIVDFSVRTDSTGKLGIVDFYNQALGTSMIEQTRQASLPILNELDQSFLQRVLGKPSTAVKDIESYGKLAEKFRQQDFKGAITLYEALPAEMKTNVAVNAMYLSALQQSGDDEGYKKALKEAAAVHKSANFQFMLVDLYFLEKNYDKAIECLDTFMAAVEKDAALLTLKGLLQMAKGDNATATTTLREGLALEPSCHYAHSKGLDIFLAAQDFESAASSMKYLETTGKYDFKSSMSDPVWADFLKSTASQPWR